MYIYKILEFFHSSINYYNDLLHLLLLLKINLTSDLFF